MATVRTARTRAVCSAFMAVPRAGLPRLSRSSVLALQIISLANLWKTPCMDLLCPWVMDKQSERISVENPQRNPASNGTEYGRVIYFWAMSGKNYSNLAQN